jgi:tRNA U38,U39,U40 pseudouridine synthase TruA
LEAGYTEFLKFIRNHGSSQRLYAYHITHKLNAAAMREAANHFIGTHDLSASVNSSRNDG